jgi:hypothetical protein
MEEKAIALGDRRSAIAPLTADYPLSLPLSLLVLVPVKVTVAMAALALFLLPLLLLQESCEPRRHHRLRAFTREFASRTPSLVFEEGQTTDVRSAMCYQRN